MTVIAGIGASVALTTGPSGSTTFTNEATTGNAGRTVYTITNATKRLWDDSATFTVQHDIGAGYVTVTNYTLDYATGAITFSVAEDVGALVRVSGKYLTASVVAQASEWSLDLKLSLEDASVFGDTWEAFSPTLKGASGSLKLLWADDAMLTTNLGTRLIVRLYTESTKHYVARCIIDGDAIKTGLTSLVDEDIKFTVNGAVSYAAS